MVNNTKVGGRIAAWVANSTFGCLPLRTGGGVAAMRSESQPLSCPVGTRVSHDPSEVRRAGASLRTARPVSAETLTRSAHGTRTSPRSSSRSSWCLRSSSTRSHLFSASTQARPDSTTMVSTRRSCSEIGSLASSSTIATSAASIAALVRSEA